MQQFEFGFRKIIKILKNLCIKEIIILTIQNRTRTVNAYR